MARKKKQQEGSNQLATFRAVVEAGRHSEFWQALKTVIQKNVDFLSSRLEDNTDEIPDSKLRLMLKWRNLNKELLNLPETLIRSADNALKGGESEADWSELDPYYKNYQQIMQDERE